MEADTSLRTEFESAEALRIGDFVFDPGTRELWRDGEPVDLPPQPGKLLQLLVRHAGRLVTRDQLLEHLWEDSVVEPDPAINNAVRQVRNILGDDASDPRYVATVPRRGYRFVAAVEPVREPGTRAADEVADATGANDASRDASVFRGKSARRIVLLAVGAAAAAAAWVVADPLPDDTMVVAVVPARTPEPDSLAEALAATVTSSVAAALEGLDDESLEVIPWDASMWYDTQRHAVMRDDDPVDVDFAVDINLYRYEQIEIAVSLFRFPGGRQVWYRRFEHPTDEAELAIDRAVAELTAVVDRERRAMASRD